MFASALKTIFFNERVVFAFAAQLFTSTSMGLLTRRLLVTYRERGHPAAKYLSRTTLFLAFTSSFQLLDMLLFTPFLDVGGLGYGLAYTWSAVANVFMLWFALEIFSTGVDTAGASAKAFVVLEGVVAVATPLVALLAEPAVILVLGVHMGAALVLYFWLFGQTREAAQKVDEQDAKRGFQLLGLGVACIIAAYVSFVMDRVWTTLFLPEGYTAFTVVGWLFAASAGILLYFGFTLPARRKKGQRAAGAADEREGGGETS
ncbi:MAG: hypothetical protein Kow0069_12190 [Promethearchaeota archaeon]